MSGTRYGDWRLTAASRFVRFRRREQSGSPPYRTVRAVWRAAVFSVSALFILIEMEPILSKPLALVQRQVCPLQISVIVKVQVRDIGQP